METHNGMLYQDVTELPVLRRKLERAARKFLYPYNVEGARWSLAKDVKGHLTMLSVGSVYGPVKFDVGTEEFVVEYMRKQVSY